MSFEFLWESYKDLPVVAQFQTVQSVIQHQQVVLCANLIRKGQVAVKTQKSKILIPQNTFKGFCLVNFLHNGLKTCKMYSASIITAVFLHITHTEIIKHFTEAFDHLGMISSVYKL